MGENVGFSNRQAGYIIIDEPFESAGYHYHGFIFIDAKGEFKDNSGYVDISGDNFIDYGRREPYEVVFEIVSPEGMFWVDELGERREQTQIIVRYKVALERLIISIEADVNIELDRAYITPHIYLYDMVSASWTHWTWCGLELNTDSADYSGSWTNINCCETYDSWFSPGTHSVYIRSSDVGDSREFYIYENRNYNESSFAGIDTYVVNFTIEDPFANEDDDSGNDDAIDNNNQNNSNTNDNQNTTTDTTNPQPEDESFPIYIIIIVGAVVVAGGIVTTVVIIKKKKK